MSLAIPGAGAILAWELHAHELNALLRSSRSRALCWDWRALCNAGLGTGNSTTMHPAAGLQKPELLHRCAGGLERPEQSGK